jgi:hypothetical protein
LPAAALGAPAARQSGHGHTRDNQRHSLELTPAAVKTHRVAIHYQHVQQQLR